MTIHRKLLPLAAVALLAAACSSSGKSSVSSNGTSAPAAGNGSSSSTASSGSSPGTMFSTATVSGLGTVVVDGGGKTVYVLTPDGKTNGNCDDASGCTKVWPDLPFPSGVSSAQAGSGIQASLLGTKKESDGQTYPTYNKWLMYEFSGDSGPGQGHGEGIHSFGGTWYALDASGHPVMPGSSGGSAGSGSTSSMGGSGY